jgi:hypothetical protein
LEQSVSTETTETEANAPSSVQVVPSGPDSLLPTFILVLTGVVGVVCNRQSLGHVLQAQEAGP